MKMCLIPTFLTPASRDHLHMCLSKIAQAGQVSPVCEIKLAAVLIDLNVQKARNPPQIRHTWRFFFFPPLSGTSGELGWLPAHLSLVSRQDDRLLAQWSNVLLTTWLWRSQVWSVWGQNRQLRQFSKSLHPGGSLARSSFPITLGRRQIPYEISWHRRWSQSNFVGVCENPWTCKGSFWLKKKMVVLLLAPDCCFNWTDDRTGFNKDETAFRWIPFNA